MGGGGGDGGGGGGMEAGPRPGAGEESESTEDEDGDDDEDEHAGEDAMDEEEFYKLNEQLDQADQLADFLLAQAETLEARMRATLETSRREREALAAQQEAELEADIAATATDKTLDS